MSTKLGKSNGKPKTGNTRRRRRKPLRRLPIRAKRAEIERRVGHDVATGRRAATTAGLMPINIYLAPALITRVKLEALGRDAAARELRVMGVEANEQTVRTKGVSGLIEQLLRNYFEEIDSKRGAVDGE